MTTNILLVLGYVILQEMSSTNLLSYIPEMRTYLSAGSPLLSRFLLLYVKECQKIINESAK